MYRIARRNNKGHGGVQQKTAEKTKFIPADVFANGDRSDRFHTRCNKGGQNAGHNTNLGGTFVNTTRLSKSNMADSPANVFREVFGVPQRPHPLAFTDTNAKPVNTSNIALVVRAKPIALTPKQTVDLSCRDEVCTPTTRQVQVRSSGQVLSTGGVSSVAPKTTGLSTSSGFAKLDLTTLQNLGWADKGDTCSACSRQFFNLPLVTTDTTTAATADATTNTIVSNPTSAMISHGTSDNGNFGLTKVEFRRLTEQVRDVSNIIKNKFRKPEPEKLFRLTPVTSPDPATQALHVELQASRFPFQPRQWRPLTPDILPEFTITRCRPVSARPTTAHPASRSTPIPLVVPERPRSVPVHGRRTSHAPRPPAFARPDTPRVTPGNFDTLSPRVLSQLLEDVSPRPPSASYGDRVLTSQDRRRGARDGKDSFRQTFYDDQSTTSGFDSDDDENEEEDDDASDSENGGLEPSLDEARRKVPNPQNVLHLRPERLDAIYVPEDKRDMRRFDFDASNVELPPYNFSCPLPENLDKLNLRLCAREGTDWREQAIKPTYPVPNATPLILDMVDRLVELERQQMVTVDWENKRLRQLAKRQQASAASNSSTSVGTRATSAKVRDKRCCWMCLQAACVGDCPDKRLRAAPSGRCDKCQQPLCTGACQDTKYEQRMRQARNGEALELESVNPTSLPPRSPSRGCNSCQRRHNAKLINANNVVLRRPKSSNATFSRGKASSRPRDLRPASAVSMNTSMLKDFEKLGIEPQQPSPPAKGPPTRPRSRNGLLPGKSSRSNRKNSLTDTGGRRKKSRNKSAHGSRQAQAVS